MRNYRVRQKVIPYEKCYVFGTVADFFKPNLQHLQMRIQSTYPANFIAMFICIQKL